MKSINRFKKLGLFKILLPILRGYFSRQEYDKMVTQPTKFERYNIDVLLSAYKIIDCLDQIYFSIEMLSGFKSKSNSVMNQHDYIVFMLENFYLRITSAFDRILRFTNVVFEIGLPEKECKESKIIKNDKIKETSLCNILTKLNTYINKYKNSRNKIAHSESYSDKDLIEIEGYFLLLESDNQKDIEDYKPYFKRVTDEYVGNKKKELMEYANEFEELLKKFFDDTVPYVDTIGQRYQEQKQTSTC